MPKVKYVAADGADTVVEIENGTSVMRGAVNNGVRGIDADCGGECACATCHVIVDEAWADKIEPASEMETNMIAFVDDLKPTSRLSCQIEMTPALDGLVVRLPESQH
ncbi:MAG: 2Fe-2S iron-sulfur cluster binding domain-containing protein [Rhodoblastus sp.]|nr:2Fe-2S iron-sulfur cluster binding domain-containing protein [Rhodoblastus sp.]